MALHRRPGMPAGILLAALAAVLLAGAPVRAAELDKYLPEDSESVVNFNVRQLLDSALFKKHALAAAQEKLKEFDQVQDVLNDLGFDPFKDLDRVIAASPTGTDKDRGLIVVHGRFDLAKFKAKGAEAAENHGDVLKIHKVPDGKGGQNLVYEVNLPDQDQPLFVALAARDTLLASPGKDYVVDALKKTSRTSKPVLKNKEFQALLEKVDDRQTLSMAAVKTEAVRKALGGLDGDIRAMLDKVAAASGGITLSEDIKLEVVVTSKTAAQAGEFRDSADAGLRLALVGLTALTGRKKDTNPALDLALEIVKSTRITNPGKGKSVVIKGRITADYIEETLKKGQ